MDSRSEKSQRGSGLYALLPWRLDALLPGALFIMHSYASLCPLPDKYPNPCQVDISSSLQLGY